MKEYASAFMFLLVVVAAWIAGFWHPMIHVLQALVGVVLVGWFPVWIVASTRSTRTKFAEMISEGPHDVRS